MKNELVIFKNAEFGEVRVININGEGWLVGKDVAEVLGYKDTSDALKKHVDTEDKMSRQIADSLGRLQNTQVINESGLYSLILKSKLPQAKKFKRWVTSEVLPSIRKHGAYMTNEVLEKTLTDPDYMIGLLTKLKEEKQARLKAEEENKILIAENETISLENRLLNGEVFAWAGRPLINSIIRVYAKGDFAKAWNIYKKELLYKHSININSRITNYLNKTSKKTKPKTLDMLDDSEIPNAIATAISMCNEASIDISDIIKHFKDNN